MPGKLKILIDKRVMRGFIRRALKAYPLEYVELVWGNVEGNEIHIKVLHDIEHEGTRRAVTYDDEAISKGRQEARALGMDLLGDVHSHPDTMDASPSEDDWQDGASNSQILLGICSIWKLKSGRRRTRLVFWPCPPDTVLEVTYNE